ncbi:MAG: hypothetical protein DRN27_09770, partial [Thermoplasmata archaeon]
MENKLEEKPIKYRFSDIDEKAINSIVKLHISPSLFARNCQLQNDDTLLYELGNCFPKMIWDHDRNIAVYRYIDIHPIGLLEVEKINSKLVKIRHPDLESLGKKFEERMHIIRKKSELSILETTYDYLVTIPAVQQSLNPFSRILRKIYNNDPLDIAYNFGYNNSEKVQRYLKLLNNFDFIEIQNNKIYPGLEINALQNTDFT